jgi:multisubunit Na+/H+ antiporter MnhC subunit
VAVCHRPIRRHNQQQPHSYGHLSFDHSVIDLCSSDSYRLNQGPPIYYHIPAGTAAVDPVVQALTFTDIVVGATVSALLLALAVQVYKHRGTLDPDMLRPMAHKGRE